MSGPGTYLKFYSNKSKRYKNVNLRSSRYAISKNGIMHVLPTY